MNQIAVATLACPKTDMHALSNVLLSSNFVSYIDTVSGSHNGAHRSYDAQRRIPGETDMMWRLKRVSNAHRIRAV